jgi:methionyl-tRNA synthetase
MKTFYVTTPIYYVNDEPHIGHAYTTILADVLVRYHRLFGEDSFFLTGLDEHGQKVQEAAAKRAVTPQEHCDQMAPRFTELWKKLEITYDDFVRTTQERHQKVVRLILERLHQQGQIYAAEYDGWYCVPDERFWTEKDLADGNCPDCGRPVSRITEKNYFFRMSQHQEWLIEAIQTGEMTILPESRRNEVLGFLKQPLNDLCISRPKKRLAWGIELPFDPDYVTYVWFDALINYISAIGYGSREPSRFDILWPQARHLIGKDILTTHAVYWPTMLHAAGIRPPRTILAHGWWLVDDAKMSKSKGKTVRPLDMASIYGVDEFRYFLMREMTLGMDSNFSEEALVGRINSDLANDYGNLASRVLKMVESYCGGLVPEVTKIRQEDQELKSLALGLGEKVKELVDQYNLNAALAAVMDAVKATNRYVESNAPWKLAKEGNQERIDTVLGTAAETLRICSVLLSPAMPAKCRLLLSMLGIRDEPLLEQAQRWGLVKPGTKVKAGEPLFPRIEDKTILRLRSGLGNENGKRKMEELKPKEEVRGEKGDVAPAEELVDIDYFKKIKLRTADVVAAEKVQGADKLLRLQIRIGQETRQILAGIAQWYLPESLVGKQIVVVANLKPAKIRGLESNGMLLAAQDKDGVVILTPERRTESGSGIK